MKGVKYYNFWPNFQRKIQSVLSINLTLFDLETQNLKVRSITETVLEKSKQKTFRARCFFEQAILRKLTGL